MPMVVEAVEEISAKAGPGEVRRSPLPAVRITRRRFFHYMAAADFSLGFVADEAYTYVRGSCDFLFTL